jgi:succinyl-diaminopimelate desuccinylase
VQENRIYGRASLDMKGSVAVLLRLMRDLAAQDPRPDVGIQIVGDEEIGGEDGTRRLLQEGWTCRFFLSAEPTNLRICYQQKGIMWLKLVMKGNPTHGSRPWEGHNPLWTLGNGLEALARRFPVPTSEAWCTTATPTVVQAGGKSVNQIPDQVILKLDIRYIPDDAPDQVIAAIAACFPHTSMDILKLAPPLATDPDDPYVKRLAQSLERVQDSPAVLYREHFGSDARFYSEQGIPAVCFGPDGMGMHADDEWVDSDSLLQVYQVLRDVVSRESQD